VFNSVNLNLQTFQNDYTQFSDLKAQVQEFQLCVDTQKIDHDFGTGVYGLAYNATNGTSTNLTASMWDWSCEQPTPIMPAATFDCNRIPQCELTCAPENGSEQMEYATFHAACLTEGWVHAGVFGSFLSFLAFVLLNLSRWTILRGLRSVFWRHFSTAEYQYIATCNEFGDIEYPERVTQEGASMKETLRDELHVTIQQFERMGLLFVAVAFVMNLPWIIILEQVAAGLNAQGDC